MLNKNSLAYELVEALTSGVGGADCFADGSLFTRFVDCGLPRNFVTGKAYQGSNLIVLWVSMLTMGYGEGRWATYRQAEGKGGQVAKGSKGTQVIRVVAGLSKDQAGADPKNPRRYRSLKGFYVFNCRQIDGIEALDMPKGFTGDAQADAVIDAIAGQGAMIDYTRDGCFYVPRLDEVCMPPRARFQSEANFYRGIFHELAHWTGHESRLARSLMHAANTPQYAREELIADLTAALMCARLEIKGCMVEHHASYMQGYIEILEAEPVIIFDVLKEAQEAYNYLCKLAGLEEGEAVPEASDAEACEA